ncbi:TonB-dependent receptor [Brevundimonas variabilis]|uniref:Outer membrane receptor protein involved in Fe transport n=1 Tax=Brevundimonas variabilis TaxID=74312 RepID=A0A7W9CI90_9CAUL|nr:TonB-dependent receptor [Brevundimonas variabilis]MBB5745712.1 outer membrane receptor protein involved in Fe transport [Brevundimonas variabilis]
MRRLSLLSGIASAACVIAISSSACAQEQRTYNIPPGSLRDALNQFATQSDQQLFYSGELVRGLQSSGLRGRYTPSQALDALLAGSNLAWSETRPGVIFLRSSNTIVEAETTVDEIVVTGTLLTAAGQLTSPVQTLNRDALDARGLGSVAEVLATLPQNYAGSANPAASLTLTDRAGSNSALATGVNLRGLGPDATLVLVNGRRLAGTGFRGEFADVSALPSAAVERVDILLDGASALYGADAVAGVVNVIMRRSFDGQETRARISAAQGGAETFLVSHLVGRDWSSGTGLLSYEYQTANALNSADRPYTADGDLRPFGGTDRRAVFASPGNIVALDRPSGAYVSQFAIRPNASGTAQSPSDFAAGERSLSNQLQGVDLIPETERHSVYGRVRQDLSDRVELSADLRFSRREYGLDTGTTATIFQVTRANPFFVSPTGASAHLLGYSFINDLGVTRREGSSRSLGLTAGGSIALGPDWSLEGYLAFAEERGRTRTGNRVNSLFLNEALGNTADNPATTYSAVRDGYFNPFGDGRANTQNVLDFIGSGYSSADDRSRAESVNLLLEGPAFSLPGGDVQIALGAQVRRESLGSRLETFASSLAPVETVVPKRDRTIAAVFAEARVPLVGPANARPGLQSLDLSVAARVEEYDDFGTTSNPKLGIIWSPASDWFVRGSFGTSFRAAALPQLFDLSAAAPTFVPKANGASVLVLYRYGGNPDLKPETAETWTAGFEYAPRGGPRFSGSYFNTQFSDRIAQPVNENLTGALVDPALAPFVDLVDPGNNAQDLALIQSYLNDPTFGFRDLFPATSYGAILDARWVNAASVFVQGIDLSVAYPLTFGRHAVFFDANASYLLDFKTRFTPTASDRQRLGLIGNPTRLRSRAGATWSYGDARASLHWNHVGAYDDNVGREIKPWNTVDMQVAWSPQNPALDGVQVSLSVQNLFDADPPFYDAPIGLGFDAAQANLLGRIVALQLTRRW